MGSQIRQLKFKKRGIAEVEAYDLSWESSFETTGYKKIYEILKLTLSLFIDKDCCLSDKIFVKEINGEIKKIKNISVNTFDNLINNDIITSTLEGNVIIPAIRNDANFDFIMEILLEKYNDIEIGEDFKPDCEDLFLLRPILLFGFMSKHQFKNLQDFSKSIEKWYSQNLRAEDYITYDKSKICFDEKQVKALYLQAPNITKSIVSEEIIRNLDSFDNSSLWGEFRAIDASSNANKAVSAILKTTMSNKDFLKMLLSLNNKYPIEVCRVINTAENTQINYIYNTDYLFDKIGIFV